MSQLPEVIRDIERVSADVVAKASSFQAAILADVAGRLAEIQSVREANQLKVLHALQEARLSESQLGGTTGYGYDDLGREQIERAFALAFGAEAALVRIQISS